ncbi:type I-F CRISPR-associated helicase Cas3f [Succinimonas amylolytica]|uniref:type I-F CRISPR-associated helicase Cas3f n=1 Tax=Succinimonas amylolytica TaxID=83769 RepID=UPI000366949D|nr:type I-F CRISPR-associated helicase Cas3f [Succinimonas amylolytica]
MMVMFISESEKNAIKSTRKVLDAFANRIGENTWQTVITKEGLEMVRHLLRQTASKNTSVSCHWIRSRQISELLWVVGNKNKFDEDGNVPVNSTGRKILKHYKETGWNFMPLVQALSAVAALMHDIGKASSYFQDKLRNSSCTADPFRHEFVSAIIIQGISRYYAENGRDIWTELAAGNMPQIADFIHHCRDPEKENKPQYHPFRKESSIVLCCIVWLVLSHHRLPLPVNARGDTVTKNDLSNGATSISELLSYITPGYTYRRFTENNSDDTRNFKADLNHCFDFSYEFSDFSEKWRNDLKKWCYRLLEASSEIEKFANDGTLRLVLRYARLSLMLGDHFYSSLEADPKWKSNCSLYANTDRERGGFRQKLDEHLCGVKNIALKVSHYLPALENDLPHTGIIQALKHKSKGKYIWQDQAVTAIKKFRTENPDVIGGFILNLASTGCGKTTANAKIATTFGENPGTLRFTLALGLRTLTLQTGDEYRDRLRLTDEELAVVIGSASVQYLHEQERKQHILEKKLFPQESDENMFGGSESLEDLYEDETFFEGELPHEGFATLFKNSASSKMLYAPVLCCTIDQIMNATECCRGGRYMLPLLRIMSSDLIIDEVDDFTGNDLKAIGRLIHLCGTLGRKVVLSSATIPPEIAICYFYAYKEGFKNYCDARAIKPNIMVAWLDENESSVEKISCIESSQNLNFGRLHSNFSKRQTDRLKRSVPLRTGYICNCPIENDDNYSDKKENRTEIYFEHMLQAALSLHHNHHLHDAESGKKVSFGVIRFANIDPCVEFAKYLCKYSLPADTEIKIMVYHSRQTLLLRHEEEQYLDNILKRHGENPQAPVILTDPVIRKLIDTTFTTNILFIVICTPVEEVGRDHDYDWAVIEPSSWRSIVQMSGRVNRHRQIPILTPNIAIMQYNIKAFKYKNRKSWDNGKTCLYYTKPGYETAHPSMPSHDMKMLLPSWNNIINAADRLTMISDYKTPPNNGNIIAWYEHKVIKCLLYSNEPDSTKEYPVSYWDLSAITQKLSRFRDSTPTITLTLKKCEPDENYYSFYIHDKQNNLTKVENIYNINNTSLQDIKLFNSRMWLMRDYGSTIEKYAVLNGIQSTEVMERFGTIEIPDYGNVANWNYSDVFGMYKTDKGEHNEDDR